MSEYSHPQFRKVKAMLGALSARISSVPELKKWGVTYTLNETDRSDAETFIY